MRRWKMGRFGFKAAVSAGLSLALLLGAPQPGFAQAGDSLQVSWHEADFVIHDFHFRSGESLADLRLHYITLGTPARDAAGRITNAVLILHSTGGSGGQFLLSQFAGELFRPGQLLDARRYYIILPDAIGHARSSKPSDGLRMRFPHYDYDDMVAAEHQLVTEGLGVSHLRLIMGASMGCMHAFIWGETWPDAMDALMPLACTPEPIIGRNRLWRRMIIDVIESDPAWLGGDYASEPMDGVRAANDIEVIAGSVPVEMQKTLATQDDVDRKLRSSDRSAQQMDADDLIYELDASRNYDPSAGLGSITAPVMWVNSADDFINPPELQIGEREAPRLKRGRFVLLPISPNTHGHGTHTWAVAWKPYLAALLAESSR